MSKIHIVYYSYLGGAEPYENGKYFWQDVIRGQLKDIKNSGVMEVAKLYVVICSEKTNLLEECKNIVNEMCNTLDKAKPINYTIDLETVNRYEYPGIKKIYNISKENPDSICLYMHSKQLGHSNVMENHRGHTEMVCTQNTVNNWRKIVDIFNLYPEINKVCLFPSNEGFSWFNFWWARTNYIIKCNEPTIEEDRYYYERWVGEQGSNTYKDCISIVTNTVQNFSGSEACGIVNRLPFSY